MENGIRPPIQMAVDSMRNLCLGYTGEANAQLIQIDVSKWQEKWTGASIDLMLALPGEKASYPAKTELQDGKLLFLPGYGDTQKPGHGAAYVVATKDGTHLAASDTVLTEIMHKGRGGDELPEAPEAQAGWVADVLDAAHRAEEAAQRAENAQVTDEQVGKAVEDYLKENPVEVPAYELPTASAEVKGGVKVGKGLCMDGDVMEAEVQKEDVDKLSEEIVENDIPKVFFVGVAPTTKAEDELPLTMEFISKTLRFKDYVTLKVQGDSSAGYPKKNFNLKMFSDAEMTAKDKRVFRKWAKTNKYTLKANWIDHTHARNVVNGRLWGQLVRSRADYEDYPVEYRESTNCGAVDGFPVKVYINGVYQGLYTWNIRKDDSMFNMDDSTGIHAALIADAGNAVTAWQQLPQIDGTDWTDELNDVVPDAVKQSFQDAYTFVMTATDEEFKANIGAYFYPSSLIDYYIFIYVILMIGGNFKSQTMLTYDGIKFLANIYDMDTTWALHWDGGSFYDFDTPFPEGYEAATAGYENMLYKRLASLFAEEIKVRYAEVRQTVLSDANIINEFERFMDVIPLELYAEDFAATTANGAFTSIPQADVNNLQKLREVIVTRMAYCDRKFPNLGAEVDNGGNESGALYPLTNGTIEVDGFTLTVSNGNHVRVQSQVSDQSYEVTARLDCSFPQNTQPNYAESASLHTTWFEVPAGAEVVYEVSNVVLTGGNGLIITALRTVGETKTVNGALHLSYKAGATEDTTLRATVDKNTAASYLMLYAQIPTNASVEFDVSITVDGVRYV